jgi:hypothetical protein
MRFVHNTEEQQSKDDEEKLRISLLYFNTRPQIFTLFGFQVIA